MLIICNELKKFESIYIQDPKSFSTNNFIIKQAMSTKKEVNQLKSSSFMLLNQVIFVKMNSQLSFHCLIFKLILKYSFPKFHRLFLSSHHTFLRIHN